MITTTLLVRVACIAGLAGAAAACGGSECNPVAIGGGITVTWADNATRGQQVHMCVDSVCRDGTAHGGVAGQQAFTFALDTPSLARADAVDVQIELPSRDGQPARSGRGRVSLDKVKGGCTEGRSAIVSLRPDGNLVAQTPAAPSKR